MKESKIKLGATHYSIDTKKIILESIKSGKTPTEISQTFGMSRSTIYQWIKASSLERKTGSGKQPILTLDEINRLLAYIQNPATNYGFENDLWTGPRITKLIKDKLKKKLHRTTVYRMLTEENQTFKKPEYRWSEADKNKQSLWIKTTIPAIKRFVTKNKALLFFLDESTIQLTPTKGKTWGPKGKTSIVERSGKRGRVCAISAISPKSSLIFSLQQTTFKTQGVIDFLKQIMRNHKNRKIAIVLDNASPHTSKAMKEFLSINKNIKLFFLPSYSPQWNPDEKVWNHLKSHEILSHCETSVDGLEQLTRRKLKSMQMRPKLLRGIFMRREISKFFTLSE